MNDIFKDMQVKVGCDYLSDLPSYKRKVWQEMKRLNLSLIHIYRRDSRKNKNSPHRLEK